MTALWPKSSRMMSHLLLKQGARQQLQVFNKECCRLPEQQHEEEGARFGLHVGMLRGKAADSP